MAGHLSGRDRRERIMPRPTAHALLLALMLTTGLAGCGSRDDSPDVAASEAPAPDVATPVPAATADPEAARDLFAFDSIDADGDGFISEGEHAAAWSTMFQMMDGDGDGSLTVDEMDQAREAMGRLTALSSEKMVAAADQDRNSALTLAEYVAASNTTFARRDVNGDGRISPEEWEQTRPSAASAEQEVDG